MPQPRFRSAAAAELSEALLWYDQRSPEVAHRLSIAIEAVLEAIAAGPDRYPLVTTSVRRVSVPGFPYRLYYRIFPDTVSILAFVHIRQDPTRWRRRL